MISLIATWRLKVIATIATDHQRKDLDTRGLGRTGPSGQGSRGGWARQATGWALLPRGPLGRREGMVAALPHAPNRQGCRPFAGHAHGLYIWNHK